MFIFDNGYDIFIQSIQGGDAINITNNISEKLTHPVFSPDGKQIACCTPYGLKFFSLKNNQLKETAFVTGNFTNPSWSIEDPDFGSHIAVESNESIYIISPEELKPELVISNNCQYPGWSPIDGKKLIYTYWGYIHISQIFQLIE